MPVNTTRQDPEVAMWLEILFREEHNLPLTDEQEAVRLATIHAPRSR